MKKATAILFFALSFYTAFAQSGKQQEMLRIKAARDIDGISRNRIDDFVQVRGNSNHLVGKDTIIASWKQLFATRQKVIMFATPVR